VKRRRIYSNFFLWRNNASQLSFTLSNDVAAGIRFHHAAGLYLFLKHFPRRLDPALGGNKPQVQLLGNFSLLQPFDVREAQGRAYFSGSSLIKSSTYSASSRHIWFSSSGPSSGPSSVNQNQGCTGRPDFAGSFFHHFYLSRENKN
jgi:hypothetical protein